MGLAITAGRQALPALPPCPLDAAARIAHAADARRGTQACVLALRHAGPRRVELRHELLGDAALPMVLVAGGISADRHLAASAAFPQPGWWDAQVGAGRALDPSRHCLLAIDWLGADGTLDAPLDPADQADAIAAVLDALQVDALAAFVGCSYGAMVGLQFAARHPARLQRLLAISGTDRAHPYASAWRALQRRALALGALQCDERDGLALARQLALLSYRTPEEFAARFGAAQVAGGRVRVAAEDYLDHCGDKYAARTPATAFARLSESIDLQSVDPGAIRIPVTVAAVAEDRLVPIGDAYRLVERLRGETRLRVLRSRYGHDAFLKETDAIAALLREVLADGDAGNHGCPGVAP
ncbi:homoserine O-succinyltransferase [Luteimonas sp. 50]|uniref:Homoserine O-succinyltransferase n=1 Tax=Cognatiluteimonas sedimenti TaxID=2927791 RepID=A0ABT0A454_9GAMM|nr:homoserine O-succinyltransferase [Lysobacter sedimenti]MCJ0825754.1 homoserine O-succinyltransferase [Lysobacter sedimenti]